jgi:hypothetical protein
MQRPPLSGGCWVWPIWRDVVNSHILIVLSRLPLTSSRALGENATLYTLSLWPSGPSRRSRRYPILTSHTLTLLSREPAATSLVSGEMATVVTPSSIVSVKLQLPVSKSQILTVLSPLPDAIVRPSRAKSNE